MLDAGPEMAEWQDGGMVKWWMQPAKRHQDAIN